MNLGGTARYITELVEKIPDSAIATGFTQGLEIEDPVVSHLPVFRISSLGRKVSPVADFKAWQELRKVIKTVKPEIVHTHTFKAGLIGRLVGGKQKRIHTFHGHLLFDSTFSATQKKGIITIERLLAKRTDLLISVGQNVGEELRSLHIGKGKNWVSIAPGVAEFPSHNKSKSREKLGIKNTDLIVGWMARITRVKNPMLLIKIANSLPHIHFVMAGGGDMYESVKTAAPRNVELIGWANAELFWSAIDIAISTSENEGMPIALIEAQLAGVPVIATDVGSTSEVIVNGVTGILARTDADEITLALSKLISDNVLRDKMGLDAQLHAKKVFSPKRMTDKHVEIYNYLSSR